VVCIALLELSAVLDWVEVEIDGRKMSRREGSGIKLGVENCVRSALYFLSVDRRSLSC
jgi:hypothetical protein